MVSAKSFLDIVNNTPFDFTIQVSQIDNSDWDGVSRPDKNFHNVRIASRQSNCQRAEVNTANDSNMFTMLLIFSNGDRCSFRNDQRDAFKQIEKVYKNERCWQINQKSGNGTNKFTITYNS